MRGVRKFFALRRVGLRAGLLGITLPLQQQSPSSVCSSWSSSAAGLDHFRGWSSSSSDCRLISHLLYRSLLMISSYDRMISSIDLLSPLMIGDLVVQSGGTGVGGPLPWGRFVTFCINSGLR